MMNNQTENIPLIRYVNIYSNFFYLIFGNIGNLLKVAFFLQKPLRSLPCTVYILFSTFSDFITLNNLPALQLLIHLYPNYHWIKVTIDWSNHHNQTIPLSYSASTYDIIMCKVRSYFHILSRDISLQMLLFASINRFCSSNRRKKRQIHYTHRFLRHFCDHPHVHKLCLISSFITAILSLQHVFNFTINSPSEGCVPHNQLLWVVWTSSFDCFLLPILMILFGILTLRNVRYLTVFGDHFHRLQLSRRRRKHGFVEVCSCCSHYQNSIQYQIDKQLTFMIITEIIVTIITSLPYGVYAFHNFLTTINRRTMIDSNESVWTLLFIRTTMYFEPSCGFYIYLLTLTTLRKRFFKVFIDKITGICLRYWIK